MAKLLSAALVHEKNQLFSTHVWSLLFQLAIPGAPLPYRLAHADHDVLFHGLTFLRFPLDVESLEDASTSALTRLRIVAGNVDQGLQSLLENYWGQTTPWEATVWQVDLAQPDETPFGAGDVFTVMQVATDFVTATFDVQAEAVTLASMVPKRRYTATSGFPQIPRRVF